VILKTKTTSTAAYAAVAANISGLLTLLNTDIDIASKEMKTSMSGSMSNIYI
jgi:hypothetical protein